MEGNPKKYEQLAVNRLNAHSMNFALSCPHWNETVTIYDTMLNVDKRGDTGAR